MKRRWSPWAAAALVAALVGAGCRTYDGPDSQPMGSAKGDPYAGADKAIAGAKAKKSLYERLGGEPAIAAVIDQFIVNVAADPAIQKRFDGVNIPHLKRMLVEQVCAATGGPQKYTGRDMKTVHKGMEVTDAEFDALVGDLVAALRKFNVPQQEISELAGALLPMRADIVAPKANIEQRLERIEQALLRIARALEAGARPLPLASAPPRNGSPAAPIPRPGTAKPAAPAKPAMAKPAEKPAELGEPLPQQARKWTPEERALAMKLVTRYRQAEAKEQTDPPSELLDQPLGQTRFLASNGEVYDLKDFEGKKHVVLVILRGFAGQVCINCSGQTLALARAIDEFKRRDAQIVLVYPGQKESLPLFLEAVRDLEEGFEPPFPIVLDVDLAAVRTFQIEGSLAKPTTIVIDRQGLVRYAYVGKDPADRPSAKALLEAVDRIGAGKP